MVTRVENWPLMLSMFLRERREMPFEYGKNDCVLFAADAVFAMTETDFAAPWRGKYAYKDEADLIMKDLGGVKGLINLHLGEISHNNILAARRGDIVAMKLKTGITAGVVDDTGRRIAIPVEKDNKLVRVPLNLAWRIWSY